MFWLMTFLFIKLELLDKADILDFLLASASFCCLFNTEPILQGSVHCLPNDHTERDSYFWRSSATSTNSVFQDRL